MLYQIYKRDIMNNDPNEVIPGLSDEEVNELNQKEYEQPGYVLDDEANQWLPEYGPYD